MVMGGYGHHMPNASERFGSNRLSGNYWKVAEGLGCKAIRVHKQEEIDPAIQQAEKWMAEYRVPVVIEIMLERVTNIAMGTEIDKVVEFEELAASIADAPTAVAAMLD